METQYNRDINGPRGALVLLKNIDFERIRDLGLNAAVVLYTSKNYLGSCSTARYEGVIITREGEVSCLSDLALPRQRYCWTSPDEFRKRIEKGDFVPGENLFGVPNRLEFMITAKNPKEYEGIVAFRDIVVPELFKIGYDQYNPMHSSIFWLHLGKNDAFKNKHLLCIGSREGLMVFGQEVDGIKVFTEADITRFLGLEMPK